MSVFLDISAALDTQLNAMAGLPPVAWENREYTPVVGTLYLRPTNLQGVTIASSQSDAKGQDVTIGVYQIDVFAEADKGKNEAVVMADTIADQFKMDTELTYNSRLVRVVSVSRGAANTADGWYQIPVEIVYNAYSARR